MTDISDSPDDIYKYADRVQVALLDMVRSVMREAASQGLAGGHHFFITYFTHADGVVISDKLRAQHPEEITIVLQNQYEDLEIEEDAFHVTLSFNDTPERLTVPFAAMSKFYDPSVAFGLIFDVDAPDIDFAALAEQDAMVDAILSAEESQTGAPEATAEDKKGEVVNLDSFRDK
ncbi:MAG: ClpXP protease specificity-enhancing factor SspB [Alphaproteobacteria bacterium]|jgi:hypothetical protein|nr:ClpXP protease specificity-enhancing factor SspB [Alphaproteobacteria bacterium]